jgi:hypothetical protein
MYREKFRQLERAVGDRLRAIEAHVGLDCARDALLDGGKATADITASLPAAASTFHLSTPSDGKPRVRFRGEWSDSQAYSTGAGVLHRGIGWRCKSASRGCEPGSDPLSWERV